MTSESFAPTFATAASSHHPTPRQRVSTMGWDHDVGHFARADVTAVPAAGKAPAVDVTKSWLVLRRRHVVATTTKPPPPPPPTVDASPSLHAGSHLRRQRSKRRSGTAGDSTSTHGGRTTTVVVTDACHLLAAYSRHRCRPRSAARPQISPTAIHVALVGSAPPPRTGT